MYIYMLVVTRSSADAFPANFVGRKLSTIAPTVWGRERCFEVKISTCQCINVSIN